MTESALDPFPTDDVTLSLLEHALDASYAVDEDGQHVRVGADMTVNELLDFLSGYDPTLLEQAVNEYDQPIPDWFDYPNPVYSIHDVLRALIAEVRRLRRKAEADRD